MIGRSILALCLFVGTIVPIRAADLAAVLPNDSEVVTQINVKQLLTSAVVKKYAATMIDDFMEKSPEAMQFSQLTGLDPRKDIGRIVIAGSGSDPSNIKGVVLLEGTFDVVKLNTVLGEIARTKNEAVSVVKDGDLTIYKMKGPDSPMTLFATIADKSLIVAGTSVEVVKDTIAKKNGTKKGKVTKELHDLLGRMNDDNSFSFVAVTKGKGEGLPIPQPEIARIVEKMHGISLSLNVSAEIALELGISVEDAEIANEFGDLLAQAIPQAKAFVKVIAIQQPKLKKPLTDIVATIKSSVNDKVISVNLSVPALAIDALINAAKDLRP